ncbi:MAG: 50S ribosomal protein L3 [Ignavibacteria bacterium GWF2_33_9]|nr:MAG: 50S ribosomal protein L3 [Ignavibacteria bacterium GWF2_33_9]
MKAAILGRKVGMTTLYSEEGKQVPVTMIQAGPCAVVNLRTMEKDGYSAVQVGFDEVAEKKVTKPVIGQYKKNGLKPHKVMREFRQLEGDYKIGDEITVSNFTPGDLVKVSGTSRGKGFAGVVKRHHFSGVGMTTHGQSDRQRHPGSIGQSSYPSRVLKGLRMGGQMGNKRTSVRNIEVVEIYPEQNLLLVKGSVPGGKNGLLEIVKG